MNSIYVITNNIEKEFKPYNDMYYVSADGDVYSKYTNKLLKHSIDKHGYHRVDIYENHKQIHKRIHQLVYLTWVGPIPDGIQLNHYDDNKDNNHYSNLYLGTQKQNIHDCIRNQHRVGNFQSVQIKDKNINKIINFPSILDFINYSGHPVANGSLSKCMSHKWFNDNYELISKESVTTIEQYDQLKKDYQEFLKDHNLVEYN